nr:MAG TPA: hypothetical protein [Caudoviricetes sp.]
MKSIFPSTTMLVEQVYGFTYFFSGFPIPS